jgi:hypothetical protein
MKLNSYKGYTILFLLFILILSANPASIAQSRTFVTRGIFDARKADIRSGRLALNGNWNFFPHKLLSPPETSHQTSVALMVPSLWNDDAGLTNTGYGTYSLKLILPESPEKWALEIPQLYNSYVLYIDDSVRAVNGRPSANEDSTQLEWKPQYVTFRAKRDTTHIVLQLSNFHHFKGGIREPIYIGTAKRIAGHFSGSMVSVLIEVGILLVISVFFLFLYFAGGKGRITLYFALLCIAWAIRELFSDIYPVSHLFPRINWFALVRTEYCALFFITVFSLLFINQLFQELASDLFKYLVVFINGVFFVFTLLTPVIVFTRWLPLYMITAIAVLVYAAVTIIRAMLLEKTGAWFLIGGLIVSVIAIGYDLIAYKTALANHILIGSVCYILIFVSCGLGLLQHLRIIRSSRSQANTLRYQDLYR